MIERRKKSRAVLSSQAEVFFSDNLKYTCYTKDISLSGIQLLCSTNEQRQTGETCSLKLGLTTENGTHSNITLHGTIIRKENSSISLQFTGINIEAYDLFKDYVQTHLPDSESIQNEFTNQPSPISHKTSLTTFKKEISSYLKESVEEIFNAYLFMELSTGPAITKMDHVAYKPQESLVTSLINFNGSINGGIHFSCSLKVALHMAESLAGAPFEQLDDEARDALGELANMMAGGLQTRLANNKDNNDIHLTPPTVIFGSSFQIQYNRSLSSITQHFNIETGPFFVECFFA